MIWLSLLATLALAQDGPDPLGLYAAETPAAVEGAPVAAEGTAAAPPTAPPAPGVGTPREGATVRAPIPADLGWVWSYGGPLLLLGGALGAAWVIRKKGLKIPGLSGAGLSAFTAESPAVEVKAQATLAGQNSLAVVQVNGFGPPRSLLVTAGPGGSRLVADLTPAVPQAAVPQGADAVADAIRQALGGAAGQVAASTAVPPAVIAPTVAPPAVMAVAGPVGTAPVAQAAPIAAPAPAPEPQDAIQQAPAPTSTPIPTPVEIPAPSAQGDQPQDIGSADVFDTELAGAMDRVELSRPLSPPPLPPVAPRRSREDWRARAYTQRAAEPPPAPEDLVDVIGELSSQHRRRGRASESTGRRAATPSTQGRARRAHVEALTKNAPQPIGRRFGGSSRRSAIVRDAGSRSERTQAARDLLEQVMARRRTDPS
ncbi:MAG: hypothetical protein AB8H79_13735 [Myxococcota bacterium]